MSNDLESYSLDEDAFVVKVEELCKWHKWFAWKPVKANGKWHWLGTVGRRYAIVDIARTDMAGRHFEDVDTKIDYPKYCSIEDLVINKLVDPDVNNRSTQYTHEAPE